LDSIATPTTVSSSANFFFFLKDMPLTILFITLFFFFLVELVATEESPPDAMVEEIACLFVVRKRLAPAKLEAYRMNLHDRRSQNIMKKTVKDAAQARRKRCFAFLCLLASQPTPPATATATAPSVSSLLSHPPALFLPSLYLCFISDKCRRGAPLFPLSLPQLSSLIPPHVTHRSHP